MIIEKNKVVTLNYKLSNHKTGEKIEETTTESPMVFLFGVESMIPDFENNIEGKKVGDLFKFSIDCAQAYGEKSDENATEIPLSVFYQDDGKINEKEVYVGAILPMTDNHGNHMMGKILNIESDKLTMDFNHPLAGIDLHFEGEILAIRPASEEEISHKHVHGEHGHHH